MNDTLDPTLRDLNDCGCCAGTTVQTPATVFNRQGLDQIAYRAGTHETFKRSMLALLSEAKRPALRGGLAVRDDDDFTIALLDAWAAVADVFTFYQERLANAAYLRTAGDLASVTQLARLIGYQPAPGVAAATSLAFTMEDAPGAPPQTTIGVGTKVQSIPGPGETAQTYETIEKIEARGEWNAMRPQRAVPQQFVKDVTKHAYLRGTATQLQPGDAILIVGDERENNPTSPADRERWDVRVVQTVTTNDDAGWTRVTWEEALGRASVAPAATNVRIYAFRQRAALFGHNAPDPTVLKVDTTLIESGDWKGLTNPADRIDLEASYPKVVEGTWVALAAAATSGTDRPYIELYKATRVSHPSRAQFALSGKITRIFPDTTEHLSTHFPVRTTYVYAQSEQLQFIDEPITSLPTGSPSNGIPLEDGALAPIEGGSITLDREITPIPKDRSLFVSGKRMRVRLPRSAAPLALALDSGVAVNIAPGETLVVLQPPDVQSSGNVKWRLRLDDGRLGGVTTAKTTLHLAAAAKDDAVVSELVTVASCAGSPTLLTLEQVLSNCFDRATVTIAGNVAEATHGETVDEIAGSGDASRPFQRFTLRQPPVTYLRATGGDGRRSTLAVRVDDVLWQEVPTLFDRAPHERVYIARRADDGKTTITFGDGLNGARLPSGQQNVRLKYRKGSGLAGLVQARQLTQLLSRPLGVRDVINPLAPQGADDPESLADARRNAPLTVLTLGRVVSLQDYEDYTRAYPGIAKALATWTWDGRRRGVLITVAGPSGAAVPAGDFINDLVDALRAAGDPFVPLSVRTFRDARFEVAGTIRVDPDRLLDKVQADAREALQARFAFDARDFGQPVVLSEVLAALQNVPGVTAVDIDHLQRTDVADPVDPAPRLLADLPTGGDDLLAAELLTLDPESLIKVVAAP